MKYREDNGFLDGRELRKSPPPIACKCLIMNALRNHCANSRSFHLGIVIIIFMPLLFISLLQKYKKNRNNPQFLNKKSPGNGSFSA